MKTSHSRVFSNAPRRNVSCVLHCQLQFCQLLMCIYLCALHYHLCMLHLYQLLIHSLLGLLCFAILRTPIWRGHVFFNCLNSPISSCWWLKSLLALELGLMLFSCWCHFCGLHEQTDIQGLNLTAEDEPPLKTMSVKLDLSTQEDWIGLAWMLEKESKRTYPIDGILADDQVCMRISGSRVFVWLDGMQLTTYNLGWPILGC